MSKLMLDVGTANEIKMALRRAGAVESDIKAMCKGDFMKGVIGLLHGEYELKPAAKAVDSVFDPVSFIGEGWSCDEERNPRSVTLPLLDDYSKVKLSTDWLEDCSSVDSKTRRANILADMNHIPLNIDHFFDLWTNKEKIPKKWKKVKGGITFDGDVLRGSDGRSYFLCLCWRGGLWRWDCRWFGHGCSAFFPSAVLAS